MRTRSLLLTATAAIALSAVPLSAQAKETQLLDRSTFDPAVERTASTLHLAGATAGELGGSLDVTVTALDGTLPTAFGACETASVDAVLTVSPGEQLASVTTGEICAHIIDGTLQLNTYISGRDLSYDGTEHRKAKVVGDGLIAVAVHPWGSGSASFSSTVRW